MIRFGRSQDPPSPLALAWSRDIWTAPNKTNNNTTNPTQIYIDKQIFWSQICMPNFFTLKILLVHKIFSVKNFLNWKFLGTFFTNIIFWPKGTVQLVVGDEKTTVTMVLNKNLWLEINANTSSNERMPARHRSLWRDWLCSLQFVSVLYSSHKYPQLNHGYGSFFATYNMVHCSLL